MCVYSLYNYSTGFTVLNCCPKINTPSWRIVTIQPLRIEFCELSDIQIRHTIVGAHVTRSCHMASYYYVLDSEEATGGDSYQCIVRHKMLTHSDSESASKVIASVDVRGCMHVRNTFV